MKRLEWHEEFLIRGRPDGTFAAHQVRVTGVEIDGRIVETDRVTEGLDVAALSALIGDQEAAIVAQSDAVGAKANALATALELSERRVALLEPALEKANAATLAAREESDLIKEKADKQRDAFDIERQDFAKQLKAATEGVSDTATDTPANIENKKPT